MIWGFWGVWGGDFREVDPVGIGPTPAQCECAVLPLNYGPPVDQV